MIRASSVTQFMIICCTAASPAAADELTYEKDIRPIFRAHCFDCHGATDQLEGGLDLRLVRLMTRGGDSGPALVAGMPNDSYLLERMRSGDMPPGDTRVPDDEIETIRRWIASGAKTARPEPNSIGPGLGITPEERDFWSFLPIRRPDVPDLASFEPACRVRTPIDALVRLSDESQQEFAPDADRTTLVLRAYFDLLGLPPSPEQMQRWIDDRGNDWFDRLLSELLDSPHYGERWARHWLDVAGYADSEGYTVSDAERSWAWKYRDWVIRSLNDDKPFDQFLTEQLAGDELAGPSRGDLTTQQIDLLTATGFLRMAADGTGSGANNAEGRNQVMADTLKIISTSLLGMSLQCAQCHDHRYDPIPQTDYYALRAVFEPALDWKAWKPPQQRLISLYTAADRQKAAEVEAEAQEIAKAKAEKQAEYMREALDQELMRYEEPLRAKLREAYQTAAGKRNEEQKQLLAKNPSVNITPGNLYQYIPDSRPKLADFDRQIQEARNKKPVEEFLRALVEPANHLPETKLFHRGDHQQPKQSVSPAALTVAAPAGERAEFAPDDDSLPTTGRRLGFARWLTSRDNPLVARVIVNRVWMHHFGTGLVATPADFGRLGARPENPQLLDWLADELIAQGWSLKKLHRMIMTSTVWRQSVVEGTPDNHATRSLLRLEAEAIRDRMLAVTGSLDVTLFGAPLRIKEDDTGQIVVDGAQTRRSIYVQVRRSRPVAMMHSFDAPSMETNCESRSKSTVATQSLMLLNGQFILDQAAQLADRAAKEGRAIQDVPFAVDIERFPEPREVNWQYGFGWFDEASNRTSSFTSLTHWTGSQWQAGANLPDPELGWVLLSASGGHPDISLRSVIRRWTAPSDGSIQINGTLSHPSSGGDGVRGRIVSSRSGTLGQWIAHNGSAGTSASLEVKAGDTIDFITDCRTNHTSDSFTWPVTVTLEARDQAETTFSSADQFAGPSESVDGIPGRIVRAWELAYCRKPTSDELILASEFVAQQMRTFRSMPEAIPADRTEIRQAMTNLCQVLLSSNEFLYVQ